MFCMSKKKWNSCNLHLSVFLCGGVYGVGMWVGVCVCVCVCFPLHECPTTQWDLYQALIKAIIKLMTIFM